jgi:hypothetical protein
LIIYVGSKGLDKVLNIAKTNIRKNMLKIDKDFILDTKRDGFYPKNRLKRKLWNK